LNEGFSIFKNRKVKRTGFWPQKSPSSTKQKKLLDPENFFRLNKNRTIFLQKKCLYSSSKYKKHFVDVHKYKKIFLERLLVF
jgi:hypothetical protein